MTPVLTSSDPLAAKCRLQHVFGFRETAAEPLTQGDKDILICDEESAPIVSGIPLDHIALAVPSVDAALDQALSRGARLDVRFTPDGPKEFVRKVWAAA